MLHFSYQKQEGQKIFLLNLLAIFIYFISGGCSVKTTPESILDRVYDHKESIPLCEGEIDPDISQEFSSVFPLEQNKYLLEIICFRGAYQNNYQYLLYSQDQGKDFIKTLLLETWEIDQDGRTAKKLNSVQAGLAEYQSQEKVLTIVTKYRGLGDCGALGKYQLVNDQLKLVEYRVKAACDGHYLEPEQYTKVYPMIGKN